MFKIYTIIVFSAFVGLLLLSSSCSRTGSYDDGYKVGFQKGYDKGWQEGHSEGSNILSSVTTTTTVTTTVVPYQVTIAVHPSEAGSVNITPSREAYYPGDGVDVVVTPGYGFYLDSLQINGEITENVTSIVLESDTDIEAYFLPESDKMENTAVMEYLNEYNDLVIIDVRSLPQYKSNHLPGAISIPSYEIETRWKEIPEDKIVFLYASCIQ